jgi:hypothetical protein
MLSDVTQSDRGTELKELMGQVLDSEASEEVGHFMVRRFALNDLAPGRDDTVLQGVEESPDGGAAMVEAHLHSMSEEEREDLLERAALETGRRLHAAAANLLTAVSSAHLDVDVTPEMVAVAAITELGDS